MLSLQFKSAASVDMTPHILRFLRSSYSEVRAHGAGVGRRGRRADKRLSGFRESDGASAIARAERRVRGDSRRPGV